MVFGDFINLLATAYFLQIYPKLEAMSLKVLVELRRSRPEKKLLIKSKEKYDTGEAYIY